MLGQFGFRLLPQMKSERLSTSIDSLEQCHRLEQSSYSVNQVHLVPDMSLSICFYVRLAVLRPNDKHATRKKIMVKLWVWSSDRWSENVYPIR